MGKPVRGLLIAVVATMGLALVGCGRIPEDVTSPPPAPTAGSSSDSPTPAPTTSRPPSPKPPPPRPAGPDCKRLKCIALTYDDGPFPAESTQLVATLRQQRVKATFFMLGANAESNPDAVKAIASTGSEVANHSWNHPSLTRLGTDGMKRELQRTSDALGKITSVRPRLMRPPYGNTDKRLDRVARQLGLAEIFWNVDTQDWSNRDTDQLISYVLDNAARNQVVLMHDIHATTVAAAPQIIAGLKAQGFTLVTVSELFPTLRPGGHYPEYKGRGFARRSDYPPVSPATPGNSGGSPSPTASAGVDAPR